MWYLQRDPGKEKGGQVETKKIKIQTLDNNNNV